MNGNVRSTWSACFALAAAAPLVTLVVITAGTAAAGRQRDATAPPPPPPGGALGRVRIGTYDSRAVAVAYGRSKAFLERTRDLHAQHARAKAAGDEQAADRLARDGQLLQARLHLQGFSNAPVDEILARVRDRLPELAERRGVVAIVPSTAYRDDARVEVIDVTDDLTTLFEPDERTQQVIADLKRQSPLPIEQAAQLDHKRH